MNKLQTILKNGFKAIKGVRADILSSNLEREQKRLVMDLEDSVSNMKASLDSLNDLYPDSELSLRIISKDFDPKKWVQDTQKLKVNIEMEQVKLDIAKKTFEEWFVDLSEEESIKASK